MAKPIDANMIATVNCRHIAVIDVSAILVARSGRTSIRQVGRNRLHCRRRKSNPSMVLDDLGKCCQRNEMQVRASWDAVAA